MYNVFNVRKPQKNGDKLQIHDYHTAGGKNVIKEYLSSLPEEERVLGYAITLKKRKLKTLFFLATSH